MYVCVMRLKLPRPSRSRVKVVKGAYAERKGTERGRKSDLRYGDTRGMAKVFAAGRAPLTCTHNRRLALRRPARARRCDGTRG